MVLEIIQMHSPMMPARLLTQMVMVLVIIPMLSLMMLPKLSIPIMMVLVMLATYAQILPQIQVLMRMVVPHHNLMLMEMVMTILQMISR